MKLNEVIVDIDPNDPDALNKAKQTLRKSKQNPSRANREQQLAAKNALRDARKSDSPTKALDVKIANLKAQLANLNTQRSQIKKRQKSTNEGLDIFTTSLGKASSGGKADKHTSMKECEIVYVDEHGNILHEGSVLNESAIQAFKRQGNVVKRQYRCTSGNKAGKIVAHPNDCHKRKNPKSVKAGKKSARMYKERRVNKTKITKRTALSKMISRLNDKD